MDTGPATPVPEMWFVTGRGRGINESHAWVGVCRRLRERSRRENLMATVA